MGKKRPTLRFASMGWDFRDEWSLLSRFGMGKSNFEVREDSVASCWCGAFVHLEEPDTRWCHLEP